MFTIDISAHSGIMSRMATSAEGGNRVRLECHSRLPQ